MDIIAEEIADIESLAENVLDEIDDNEDKNLSSSQCKDILNDIEGYTKNIADHADTSESNAGNAHNSLTSMSSSLDDLIFIVLRKY